MSIETRPLGRSGIHVSTLCLGTMMFGAWGNPDEAACAAIVDAALDAGVNFVDTADIYADGESEEILGRALRGRRDDVVVATKFRHPMGTGPNHQGASRRWIMQAVEGSLRRLGTDWIDLYQVHRPDPDTDIDETLAALSDLIRQGKVRAIGTSTFAASELVEAQWAAANRGRERFTSEQPPYSILARGVERDVLPTCRRHRIGAVVWAPLNGGWLTGKYQRGAPPPEGSRAAREPDHFDFEGPAHERKLAVVERLSALAGDAGLPLAHLALAWVLEHPAVTAAIIGPRTPEQLSSLLGATGVRLDPALLDEIDRLVPPGTDVHDADAGREPSGLAVAERRRQR